MKPCGQSVVPISWMGEYGIGAKTSYGAISSCRRNMVMQQPWVVNTPCYIASACHILVSCPIKVKNDVVVVSVGNSVHKSLRLLILAQIHDWENGMVLEPRIIGQNGRGVSGLSVARVLYGTSCVPFPE